MRKFMPLSRAVRNGRRHPCFGAQRVRAQARGQREADASKRTTVFAADMAPQQLAEKHFSWYAPAMKGIQVDRKRSASVLFNRIKQA